MVAISDSNQKSYYYISEETMRESIAVIHYLDYKIAELKAKISLLKEESD